jgi:hypothetical protein
MLGCGRGGSLGSVDDAVERLAGVWEVDGYAVNAEGCDQEGPPALESLGHRRFVVYGGRTLGQPWLGVLSCREAADCRELAARLASGALASGEYSYQFTTAEDGRLTAEYATSGFATADGTACTGGSASTRTLERLPGAGAERLRIEERTRAAADFPTRDGGCWTDAALPAAEGRPCTRRLTLTAKRAP